MEQINRLNDYYKRTFGSKVYKLSLNGGMTCPNRDGTIDNRGCVFCSRGGSGDFATDPSLSITAQIDKAREKVSRKIKYGKYISYFQAFTNTYASPDYLRRIYFEAIAPEDIVGLSIGTRPDCFNDEKYSLLSEINKIKPVYVELGLQTIHQKTADFIRRGYDLSVFEKAVASLLAINVNIVVHVIIGLPDEGLKEILETINYINSLSVNGIKLQLLHILRDTDLAEYYLDKSNNFHLLSLEEYAYILGECVNHLRPDIVVHRLTGDGPKKDLIAPLWSADKKRVLNYINKYFKDNNIVQGRKYSNGS